MDRIRSGFGRALRFIVLTSLPLTAAGLSLGPLLLRLVYGEEYAAAGRVLRILLLAFPLVAAVYVSGALLSGLGRLVVPLGLTAVAAALNLALDAILIPGRGAEAAAVANVVSQAAGAVLVTGYALKVLGGVRLEPPRLLAGIVASGGGGAVAWWVGTEIDGWAGLVVGLAAGLAVFSLLARIGRLLSADDARWLEDAVGDRMRRPVAVVCRLWGAPEPG
jgi:O-antigen/teichoic acid export membrane protein